MSVGKFGGALAFLGGAVLVQFALFLVLLAGASAACPQTKGKLVLCPAPPSGCTSPIQEVCEAQIQLVGNPAYGYFEDESNKPEMTETKTDPDEGHKVICYVYHSCMFYRGTCSADVWD